MRTSEKPAPTVCRARGKRTSASPHPVRLGSKSIHPTVSQNETTESWQPNGTRDPGCDPSADGTADRPGTGPVDERAGTESRSLWMTEVS